MEVKKIPNNQKNNQDGSQTTGKTGSVPGKKKGRPKGSVDKTERKRRADKKPFTTPDNGENSKMIQYAMELSSLPEIDLNNTTEVKQRINEYFNICAAYDYKPSISTLATAFRMSRFNLFDILNGKSNVIKNSESIHTIKVAYDMINSLYELYMNTGKINPVSAIFLMKNNMGYKDTTDYIITANQEQQVTLPDLVNRAGLLSE